MNGDLDWIVNDKEQENLLPYKDNGNLWILKSLKIVLAVITAIKKTLKIDNIIANSN